MPAFSRVYFRALPKSPPFFLLVAVLLSPGCDFRGIEDGAAKTDASAAQELRFDWQGVTRHVVDGDSLYIGDMDTQIRLWGVDAPERDERGYGAAKQALVDQALKKPIGCIKKDIDKYGRIIARCFQKRSGKEINRFLIESGVSQEYCRFSKGFYGHCR